MANINDLGRLIANAVKAGLQDLGGGGGGGTVINSSNTVMSKPTFTNLTPTDGGGGGVPPYGAQNVVNPPFANGGSAGGRPAFSGMVMGGLGATISMMPGASQANFVNYANTRLSGMFPPGSQGQSPVMPSRDPRTGQYNAASQYVRELSQRATITNPLDVYSGISRLAYERGFGVMGDPKADPFYQGAAALSNVVPGAGFERTATSLFNAFMDPTRQNRAMMLGLSVTDPTTGRPKDPRTIADQIWNRINSQKLGGAPITKDDIQRSLLPGRSLDSMLNMLVGEDPLARSAIIGILLAKAMSGGQSAYSLATKEKLLDLGFTTEGMTTASARAAGELGGIQSTARAETYGLTKANEAANILAESLSRLNNLLGFGTPGAMVAGFLDSINPLKLFGKAEGGAINASNAYLVGEMGPELFVPQTNGYVVPNHAIRLAGARHEGGFVHPHPHPNWSASDLDDKGRLNSDKIKEMLAYAGFKGSQVGDAMSIIGAESARRPGAEGDKDLVNAKWGPSIGLFQIRSLKDPGKYNDPMRNAQYLDDPIFNVMAGYQKSKGGTDWNAWSTAEKLGLADSSSSTTVNTVGGSGSGSGGGFFERMMSFFPTFARGMTGMASNVINYGGVKVDVILPANAKTDGKSIARDLETSLNEQALRRRVSTR